MQTKSVFTSKTFWVGIMTFLVGVLALVNEGFLTALGSTPEAQEKALAIITSISGSLMIILRFITNLPISFSGKK